jgi:hypothetical protein
MGGWDQPRALPHFRFLPQKVLQPYDIGARVHYCYELSVDNLS